MAHTKNFSQTQALIERRIALIRKLLNLPTEVHIHACGDVDQTELYYVSSFKSAPLMVRFYSAGEVSIYEFKKQYSKAHVSRLRRKESSHE